MTDTAATTKLQLHHFENYIIDMQKLIDQWGENFRQLEFMINYGKLGEGNISTEYVTNQVTEQITLDTSDLKTALEAMQQTALTTFIETELTEWWEYGKADWEETITFTFTNSYTEEPCYTVFPEANAAMIETGGLYTGVTVTPVGGQAGMRYSLMAICKGKV